MNFTRDRKLNSNTLGVRSVMRRDGNNQTVRSNIRRDSDKHLARVINVGSSDNQYIEARPAKTSTGIATTDAMRPGAQKGNL